VQLVGLVIFSYLDMQTPIEQDYTLPMRDLNSLAGFHQTTLLDFATVAAPIGLFP
jgi:hypothetical protein